MSDTPGVATSSHDAATEAEVVEQTAECDEKAESISTTNDADVPPASMPPEVDDSPCQSSNTSDTDHQSATLAADDTPVTSEPVSTDNQLPGSPVTSEPVSTTDNLLPDSPVTSEPVSTIDNLLPDTPVTSDPVSTDNQLRAENDHAEATSNSVVGLPTDAETDSSADPVGADG